MKKILPHLLLVFLPFILPGQQSKAIQRSQVIEKLGNKEYYMHHVLQGQTLAEIALAYNVSIDEIIRENVNLKGVISPGNVIRITKTSTTGQTADINTNSLTPKINSSDARNSKFGEGGIRHTVLPGETFFGISRKYNIPLDELRKANPEIQQLKLGQVMIIPLSGSAADSPKNNGLPVSDFFEGTVNQPANHAQVQKPDRSFHTKDTSDFYTVQAGETLFSLSKRFEISIDELKLLNPELSSGLKAGQIIRLKHQQPVENNQFITVKDTSVSYIYHRVRRGETIYSIARKYNIDVNDVTRYNPQALGTIKVRQILQIPVYTISTKEIVREVPQDASSETQEEQATENLSVDCRPDPETDKIYKIALMLPFFLDTAEEFIYSDSTMMMTPSNINMSFEFMQFYFGAMLAIDSLSNLGLKSKIYVYDVNNTPESLNSVLVRPELSKMNIIIGPLYSGSFDRVAKFAGEHHIWIINPLSPRNDFLQNNPFVVKAQPAAEDQVKLIGSYIKNHFHNSNILIVRQFSFSNVEQAQSLKVQLADNKVQEVVYLRDSLPGIVRRLDKNRENVIIGLSDDKVFVIDLVRKLNDIRSDYRITCFGLQEWEDYSLESDHIVNLNLHLPSRGFINYDAEQVKQFIRSFRCKYNTEPIPDRFAYVAFDVVWYFLYALMKFGNDFGDCLPTFKYRGVQIPFVFESNDLNGMENKGLTIYRIDNFRKTEVYPARP